MYVEPAGLVPEDESEIIKKWKLFYTPYGAVNGNENEEDGTDGKEGRYYFCLCPSTIHPSGQPAKIIVVFGL